MNRPGSAPPGGTVYELTVVGPMGETFRAAVTPHDAVRSEVCTVLRTAGTSASDVVDLVLLLEQKGLAVEGVYGIDT